VVSEALYENRFRHVPELTKMGARIAVEGRSAVITGPTPLHGASVTIPDIRSGAALVIAALCAEGVSELAHVYHLDRGYEDMDVKLQRLGAACERLGTDEPGSPVRDLTGVIGD
ncbi:MAG TPA: UDP-N-acetylglucosamine 1-carboxyvinyltransferase, partial [Candidatus Dormibacteraeota bacterium]|nr:UDP-N-acetylglucosamine 1-carboxyvinyltransferase [Candidatus Dormibacteraeota bacterium]